MSVSGSESGSSKNDDMIDLYRMMVVSGAK